MASSREDHFVYRPPLSPLGMKPMERIPWSLSEMAQKIFARDSSRDSSFVFHSIPDAWCSFFFLFLFFLFFFLQHLPCRYIEHYNPYYARILFDNEDHDERPFSSPRRFLITIHVGWLIEPRDWLYTFPSIFERSRDGMVVTHVTHGVDIASRKLFFALERLLH